jgi:hypothetical protein
VNDQPALYAGPHDHEVCGILFEDSCKACREEWGDQMVKKATEDEQMSREVATWAAQRGAVDVAAIRARLTRRTTK